MALTAKEKAARFDLLQAAIRFTGENYRTRRAECLKNYEAYGADVGILGAYNKGMADAYEVMIETMQPLRKSPEPLQTGGRRRPREGDGRPACTCRGSLGEGGQQ